MNPYHISVCYVQDLWNGWYWKKHIIYGLWEMYAYEVRVDIQMAWRGRGGTVHLSSKGVLHKQLYQLWKHGFYGNKSGLHISF